MIDRKKLLFYHFEFFINKPFIREGFKDYLSIPSLKKYP